jgi:hypothetical protein
VTQMESLIPATTIYCDEGRRLLDALANAIHDLLLVHQQQFKALLQGEDLGSSRFDLLIHEANQVKAAAKYAYLNHLEEHGCSKLD